VILVLGLSPAWQQILEFDDLRAGEVNRARAAQWCASGKAPNVALALAHLGVPQTLTTTFGGWSGAAMKSDWRRLGVADRCAESAAPTRVCTTVLIGGQATELVEESAPLAPAELERYAELARDGARSARCIVVAGSSPNNVPDDFWRKALADFDGQLIVDVRGPALEALLDLHPTFVKPNRAELAATVGRKLETTADVERAAEALRRRGARNVLVTDGAERVLHLDESGARYFRPPKVQVVNPIGCGDCLAAGLAWRIDMDENPRDAIRWGLACAAANAEMSLPARLDLPHVTELASQIRSA
jgi:1-phosphofructokinase family hexose kinase